MNIVDIVDVCAKRDAKQHVELIVEASETRVSIRAGGHPQVVHAATRVGIQWASTRVGVRGASRPTGETNLKAPKTPKKSNLKVRLLESQTDPAPLPSRYTELGWV